MRTALAVAAVTLASAQLFPPPDTRLVLAAADATELVQVLADATEVQGICYGWHVEVRDDADGNGGVDRGSSNGVDTWATTCERWIQFEADIHYTSEMSEAEDSATFEVTSNIPGAPIRRDLAALGIDGGRLLGDNDDLAVIEATSALPLLAAEAGVAPPVPLVANTEALPAGDGPTGRPGSDWLRTNAALLGFGVLLVLCGGGWAVLALLRPRWMSHVKEAVSDG